MPKILILHPYDKTTTFLRDIHQPLEEEIGENIVVFNIDTNYKSHSLALDEIRKENYETIIFMGHGRSDSLHGARGDDYDEDSDLDEQIMRANSNLYHEPKFINHYNIRHFSKKKVFCLSCKSMEKLAKWAITEGGTNVFLGFGEIPTDESDYQESTVLTDEGKKDMILFRETFNQIILSSLLLAIKKRMTFEQLALLIKINVHKQIYTHVKSNTSKEIRRDVINKLLEFKKGIKVFGDASLIILTH